MILKIYKYIIIIFNNDNNNSDVIKFMKIMYSTSCISLLI